jgi:hypothetical protein
MAKFLRAGYPTWRGVAFRATQWLGGWGVTGSISR